MPEVSTVSAIHSKVVADRHEAVREIGDGATLAVGGFGLCGSPLALIDAVRMLGRRDLQVVSNNCGIEGAGLGLLAADGQISRLTISYLGANKALEQQYLAGLIDIELTPQGTLAERMRAGGAGITGFYTPTGAGTEVADGGIPVRYDPDRPGEVLIRSAARETRRFEDGRLCVLERAITAEFGLIRAWKGDRLGNLVFRRSAQNFNPLAAMCAEVSIAEVEHLVEPEELGAETIHLPGIHVQRVVPLTPEEAANKQIEVDLTGGNR